MSDKLHSTSNSGIYLIINTKNDRVYIGQAQDFRKRWRDHKWMFAIGKHKNRHLQAAWNKYGIKNFKFMVLEQCSIEQLNEREQHYLDIYMPKGICYNIAVDATSPMRGRKASEETRQKMSEASRNVSIETRQKLSKTSKGRVHSIETRRKISEANRNRLPMSEETKQKLSKVNKGKILSDETRKRISEARKGMSFSDNTRRRMSEAGKNRPPISDETRKRLSEAGKIRCAREKAAKKSQPDQ